MSKLYKTSSAERFQLIARMDEKVFHIDDLARLWKIRDANTLRITLHRYVAKGLLHRIYRGFYAILPPEKLDPAFLGIKAMHRYSYISTESVLVECGILQQVIAKITLVSSQSKKFNIGPFEYQCRKLQDVHLYNPLGIQDAPPCRKAGLERSVCDLLYFNPGAHFDRPEGIDWKRIRDMQNAIGYPATPRPGS